MIIVGIFDRKAQSFVEMGTTPNPNVAARQFAESVNKQSENPVYKWPGDFELYELGTFDTNTGLVKATEKRLIISGDAAKQS